MITNRTDNLTGTAASPGDVAEAQYEHWHHWPVNWTAVWVGALAAITAALIFGLCGIALGAHLLGPENRVVDLHKVSIGALVCSISGAFFAFVIGGWVAGKVAGILRSEPAMLHGAVVWLVAVPLLLILASLGAGSFFGGWYAGLNGSPASASALPFDRPDALGMETNEYHSQMAEYNRKLREWRDQTPQATRNSALGAVTALLLGLVGSILGGWMASGEPMNFTHHRTRTFGARTRV